MGDGNIDGNIGEDPGIEITRIEIIMIITRDGGEEDFEDVAVIGGNLFPGAGPSRILPREGTFFLRMRKGEEDEEEFGSIIFIKDSCNNITDLEEEEKRKNIRL